MNNNIVLDIDSDVFSDVYWKICDVEERIRLIYGGTGAGKSFTVAQDEVLKSCASQQTTLFIRKVGSTLKNSIYKNIKRRIDEFGITEFTTQTVSPMEIHFQRSKSIMLFAGLDDPEKMKSIEGVSRIVVEEASELDFEDFKELNRRLRGIPGVQITLMFNPIDEDHWLKKHFFDQIIKNCKIIHTTYKDNQFLLASDIEEIEAMKDYDENQYNIYALGLWGKLKTGNEFLPHFSYVKHTGSVPFIKSKPIHLSLDFNVLPYQPMVCAQIQENVVRWRNKITRKRYKEYQDGLELEYITQVRFFKEYTGTSGEFPDNTVISVAEAFKMDFKDEQCDIFYYGDASGKYRTAGKGDGTNFKDFANTMGGWLSNRSDRVPRSNPSVLKARQFMNQVFYDKHAIEIMIDIDNAPKLARDLSTIMLGADGVLKEMVVDKKTKIRYQKNSHLHDAAKYMIIALFMDLYKNSGIK